MTCPFKTKDADTLDEDALQRFTTVGDYLWKGIKAKPDVKMGLWEDAMKANAPDALNTGDLLTIRQNMRAINERATGVSQTIHPHEAFTAALSQKFGSNKKAAAFVNDLVNATGDTKIIDKLATKGVNSLDPKETVAFNKAWEANKRGPVPKSAKPGGILDTVNGLIDNYRKSQQSGAALTGTSGTRTGSTRTTRPDTRTPIDKLAAAFAGQLSAKGAKDWRAGVGDAILQKIVDGTDLTPTESQTLTSEFAKAQEAKPGSVTRPKPVGVDEVQAQMREYRKAVATELRSNTTPKGLEAFVARTLHPEGAAKWRASVGDTILNKIHSNQTLTSTDMSKMQSAFQDALTGKPTRTPPVTSEAALEAQKTIKEAADAARAQIKANADAKTYATFQNAKAAVSEQMANVLTPEQFQAFGRDLAGVKDGDTNALHEVFQKHVPRRILDNFHQARRAAMLSGTQNVGTIAASHAALLAVEDSLIRAIAAPLSKGTVEPVNVQASLKAVQAGLHAAKDIPAIMKSGEGALTLAGKNPHFDSTKGIRPEFTVGKGAPASKVINGIVRTAGRMHHSILHVVGAIAHDRAISEMAYVMAKEDLGKGRITQAQFKDHVQEMIDNPSPGLKKRADLIAKEQMLTNDNFISDSVNALEKKAVQQGPVAEAVIKELTSSNLPFNKIPGNIGGRGLEYSPAGIIKGLGLIDKDIPPEVRANVARALARGVIGSVGIAAGYKWMLEGHIVPPDPNKGERGSWIIFGNKVDINRGAPVTSPLLLGALLANAALQRSKGIKTDWAQLAINAFPESPLSSTQERVQDLKEGKYGQALASYATQLIPTILSNAAAQFDPTHAIRQKNGVLDTVANRIPGPPISYKGQALTRQALPVKRGQTGETYPESGGLLPFPRSVPAPPPNTPLQKNLQEYYDLVDALKTKPTTQAEVDRQKAQTMRMYSLRNNELKGYFMERKGQANAKKAALPVR